MKINQTELGLSILGLVLGFAGCSSESDDNQNPVAVTSDTESNDSVRAKTKTQFLDRGLEGVSLQQLERFGVKHGAQMGPKSLSEDI